MAGGSGVKSLTPKSHTCPGMAVFAQLRGQQPGGPPRGQDEPTPPSP